MAPRPRLPSRTLRGTRHADPPHLLVRRGMTHTQVMGWLGLIAGWVGFGAVVLRCIVGSIH